MRLRFFAEEGVRVCVWSDAHGDEAQQHLQIPPNLLADMNAWIAVYNSRTQEARPGPWTEDLAVVHDARGFELSRRLQQALGDGRTVEYIFSTGQARRTASTTTPAKLSDAAGRSAPIHSSSTFSN